MVWEISMHQAFKSGSCSMLNSSMLSYNAFNIDVLALEHVEAFGFLSSCGEYRLMYDL